MLLAPPFTAPLDIASEVRARGFAVLDPTGLAAIAKASRAELDALRPFWDSLPPDPHLKDGGHYRRRRHSCYVAGPAGVSAVPHRAHWQSIDYNALHGGYERWFEPIEASMNDRPVWSRLVAGLAGICTDVQFPDRLAEGREAPWYVEAHPFRIDTTGGIGRPTPEGAHRDGVDFVFVVLIERRGVKGGETRMFDADGPAGLRFTMTEPWTTLVLDDAKKLHETTPIMPTGEGGHRDTLVVTMRRGAFQGPA